MLLAGGGALQLLYVMRTCTTTHTTRPAVLNTCLPRWREGLWGPPERAGRHANARLAFPPRLRLPAALARPFAVARVHTRQEGRCASARGLLPAGSRPRCALPAPKQPRLPSRRMAPRGWLLHTRPSRVKRLANGAGLSATAPPVRATLANGHSAPHAAPALPPPTRVLTPRCCRHPTSVAAGVTRVGARSQD